MPILNRSHNLRQFHPSGSAHGRGWEKLLERTIEILLQHNPGAFLGTVMVMGVLDQALGKQPALRVKGLLTRVKQCSQRRKWAEPNRERSRGHRA
jgi:hypothetical protein